MTPCLAYEFMRVALGISYQSSSLSSILGCYCRINRAMPEHCPKASLYRSTPMQNRASWTSRSLSVATWSDPRTMGPFHYNYHGPPVAKGVGSIPTAKWPQKHTLVWIRRRHRAWYLVGEDWDRPKCQWLERLRLQQPPCRRCCWYVVRVLLSFCRCSIKARAMQYCP